MIRIKVYICTPWSHKRLTYILYTFRTRSPMFGAHYQLSSSGTTCFQETRFYLCGKFCFIFIIIIKILWTKVWKVWRRTGDVMQLVGLEEKLRRFNEPVLEKLTMWIKLIQFMSIHYTVVWKHLSCVTITVEGCPNGLCPFIPAVGGIYFLVHMYIQSA